MSTQNSDGKSEGIALTAIVSIAASACHQAETAVENTAQQPANRQSIASVAQHSVTPTNTKRNRVVTVSVKTCDHCGAEFYTKRPAKARFCSGNCRRAAWLAANPDKAAEIAQSDRERLRAHIIANGGQWEDRQAGGGRAGLFVWLAILVVVAWFVWPTLTAARQWFNSRPLVVSMEDARPPVIAPIIPQSDQRPAALPTAVVNQQPQPTVSDQAAPAMGQLDRQIAQVTAFLRVCQQAQALNPFHDFKCEIPQKALDILQQQRAGLTPQTDQARGQTPKMAASGGSEPVRVVSQVMGLDVAIMPYDITQTPATTAAWWPESGRPGDGDNVVIWGHNYSAFRPLERAQVGQLVDVHTAGGAVYTYRLVDQATYQETGASYGQRVANGGATVAATGYERLTLITCLPFPAGDSHRLALFGELVEVVR